VNVCVALGAVTFVLNAAVLCWQVTQLTTTPPPTPTTTRDDATLPAARDEALFAYVNWLDPRFDAVTLQTTSLRADVVDGGGGRRRRVCIVAWEYEDVVVHGGGIGTAFTALARSLAHAGHEVTVLVNRADPVDYTAMLTAGWDEWRALILQRDNVTLFEPEGGIASLDKARDRCGFACVWSYVAFRWLAARDGQFDIVHFHDNAAFGYYSILARQQKQHFANTLLVVGAHGPHFWERKANRVYLTDTYNLEADYMERYMARWCDYLIAPSQFIVDWMWRNDWQLSPARVRVWQNIMPVSKLVLERRLVRSRAVMNNTAFYAGPDPKRDAALALDDAELPSGCATAECAQAHAIRPRATKRIVFFGRHETRKGLGVFIDAVRLINATLLAHGIALVFLGSQSIVQGRSSDEVHLPALPRRAAHVRAADRPRPHGGARAADDARHAHGSRVADRELAPTRCSSVSASRCRSSRLASAAFRSWSPPRTATALCSSRRRARSPIACCTSSSTGSCRRATR
jgi:glycosyltransferase involved in cell wall biosynthesis